MPRNVQTHQGLMKICLVKLGIQRRSSRLHAANLNSSMKVSTFLHRPFIRGLKGSVSCTYSCCLSKPWFVQSLKRQDDAVGNIGVGRVVGARSQIICCIIIPRCVTCGRETRLKFKREWMQESLRPHQNWLRRSPRRWGMVRSSTSILGNIQPPLTFSGSSLCKIFHLSPCPCAVKWDCFSSLIREGTSRRMCSFTYEGRLGCF